LAYTVILNGNKSKGLIHQRRKKKRRRRRKETIE
jgi:hypothetical protein